uniref:U3 small nucleolar ribonucleoprotein protein MPP10 n=1 Tax=Choanephora cucurbitarum TaxID=101091 RepID=A0A1C7NIF8_9FUNG
MSSKKTDSIHQFITNIVEKPHVFFSADQTIADNALAMAKYFYDDVKKVEPVQFSPFTELLTEGFDNDQIWEEIAAQNEPFLDYAKTALKTFNRRSTLEDMSEESETDHSMDLDQAESDQAESDEAESDQAESDQAESDEEMEEFEDEGDMSETPAQVEKPSKGVHLRNTSKKTSEVDDEFFNLDEFNKWTEQQEELDMMSDREDQDDEFDFDRDLDDLEEESEEEEEMDEQDTTVAAELLYDDFYEKPMKNKPSPAKKVQFKEEEEEEKEDDASEGSVRDLFANDDSEEENDDEKSAFQKQQERLQAQIEEFEEENVQDRHWTLRGEASAGARPVNSLLEEDLEFEHGNKPVPVITQETTNTLEEVIKKRILDNMFDDVERKVDPTLKPFVPSKRVELSDEKSKKSLADMYEDDYLSKKTGEATTDARDEALEKEHADITQMFQELCHKLDALSNFHYTPKAPKPEMSIVSNTAAISMEEVTPVNVSDATLLAPEEIYDKKRTDVKAVTEMDQAERKRLRAQKKKMKRKERDMKERELKVMQKYNPKVGEKQSKQKAVKELLGQKNVTVIGKDGQKKTNTKTVTSASLF